MARPRQLRALLVLVAVLSQQAAADGVSGQVNVTYARSVGDAPSAAASNFIQQYRLTATRSFFPNLSLNAGGMYEHSRGWLETTPPSSSSAAVYQGFANLLLTTGVLNGVAGYSRRFQTASALTGVPIGFLREDPTLSLSWRPLDLPAVSFRLSRSTTQDTSRAVEDRTSLDALLAMTWTPLQPLVLLYSAQYSNPVDRLRHSEVRTLTQSGRVQYAQTLFAGRTTVAASAAVTSRLAQTGRTGAGATIETQQAPIAGSSLVEAFPATPEQDTLLGNGALIDGNTTASAGVNVGTRPALAGDVALRDLGAQFADVSTPVNVLYLWVDRRVTPQVAATLQFSVYQSDDNLRWTPVPLTAPVTFALFQNRFELPIERTAARYLKLVVRPLDPGAVSDPAYLDLLVTELQLFLVDPVPDDRRWQGTTQALITASARTQLGPAFSHDISLVVSSPNFGARTGVGSYVLANGFSFVQQLTPWIGANARLGYQDSGDARGHRGLLSYSAVLSATALPTLTNTGAFSGQVDFTPAGPATTHALSFFTRAEPYRGVGLLASVSYSVGLLPTAQRTTAELLSVGATLRPHPKLGLAVNFGHNASRTRGGGRPDSGRRDNRIEGTFTFAPVNTLYLAGGAGWATTDTGGAPTGNLAASFSPFPGGALQLSLTFVQSLEASGGVHRLFGPSVRWNVARGMFLTASYLSLSSTTVAATSSQNFSANLQVAL